MDLLQRNYDHYLDALDKMGFCTLKILGSDEIKRLDNLYRSNFSTVPVDGLKATHNQNLVEQSLEISRGIGEIIQPALQHLFKDYNYFLGHFMVKGANVKQEFRLHQDWNIVDESRYKSYQVWIPLQITYPHNGGMFVIPGSHRFFENHRSGSYGIPFVSSEKKLDKIITDIIVPPGHALIYHNALFHASRPNLTNENRLVVIASFVEKEAPLFYFHKNQEKAQTELYPIHDDTFIAHLPHLEKGLVTPDFKLSGTMPICNTDNQKITADDLLSAYQKNMGKRNARQIKQYAVVLDQNLQHKLDMDGYAVIDFLDKEQVDFFRNEYEKRFTLDPSSGRFTTLQYVDLPTRLEIHNFIVREVDGTLRKFFKDYIVPVALFYIKKAHTSGDIDIHADTTLLLNHQLEPHYALWIPLIDTNAQNGTLTVIPKSHWVPNAFFGGSIGGYHSEHMDWLRQYEVPVELKAGQAVIFDNNLLHNSTANTTSEDRICFTFRLTHRDSSYYSFIGKPASNAIDVYEEGQEYYMRDNWDGDSRFTSGTYVGTIENGKSSISRHELEAILNS